jgi:hypothetical protein
MVEKTVPWAPVSGSEQVAEFFLTDMRTSSSLPWEIREYNAMDGK